MSQVSVYSMLCLLSAYVELVFLMFWPLNSNIVLRVVIVEFRVYFASIVSLNIKRNVSQDEGTSMN